MKNPEILYHTIVSQLWSLSEFHKEVRVMYKYKEPLFYIIDEIELNHCQ